MIKRFALSLALVFAFALPAGAQPTGFYGGLKLLDSIQGVGMSKNAFNGEYHVQNTIGGAAFMGYDFYPQNQLPLRAEIEYAIRSNVQDSARTDFSNGNIEGYVEAKGTWGLQTLLANMYLDFHNDTPFTPYVGAGLGMGFVSTTYSLTGEVKGVGKWEYSKSQTNTVFAWNVGAGCSYAFSENISADLGYRYLGLGENKVKFLGEDIKTAHNAHEFSLGLRFTF